MTTPKKTEKFEAPKPTEVKAPVTEAPKDVDGRTAEEIAEAARPEKKIDASLGNAKADQETMRKLTDEAQNNAGGVKSDAPAFPTAAKIVADVHPRVRHISEFKDGYSGHPDEVRDLG